MKYTFSLLALLALGATELRAVEQGGTTKVQIKISAVSHVQPLVKTLVETKPLQKTGPIPQDMTFSIPETTEFRVTDGASNWHTDSLFLDSLAKRGTWKVIEVTGKKRFASKKEICKEEYVWVHDNNDIRAGLYYDETVKEDFIKSVVKRFGGDLLDHEARHQSQTQKCWRPCPKLSPEEMADLAELLKKKKIQEQGYDPVIFLTLNHVRYPYKTYNNKDDKHLQSAPLVVYPFNVFQQQYLYPYPAYQQQYLYPYPAYQQQYLYPYPAYQQQYLYPYPAYQQQYLYPYPAYQQQYLYPYPAYQQQPAAIGYPANPHPFQQQNFNLNQLNDPSITKLNKDDKQLQQNSELINPANEYCSCSRTAS